MVTVARSPVAILPNVGMSQSGLMISALLAGFVVYLAIKQRLGVYWSILIGGGGTSTTTPQPSASTGTATAPAATTTTTTTPSNSSLGLPTSLGSYFGLGGTTATTTATGGVGTATPTGIAGLPNTSLDNFFGLQ
jgi:hypothetical protein